MKIHAQFETSSKQLSKIYNLKALGSFHDLHFYVVEDLFRVAKMIQELLLLIRFRGKIKCRKSKHRKISTKRRKISHLFMQ